MTASQKSADTTPHDPLMTPEQASEWLQVPVPTLKNWRSQGEGPPYVKVGRFVRYEPGSLAAWVKKQTVGAA
jgi:predicted DNA-binding transcriptional regulator AlpA